MEDQLSSNEDLDEPDSPGLRGYIIDSGSPRNHFFNHSHFSEQERDPRAENLRAKEARREQELVAKAARRMEKERIANEARLRKEEREA